MEKYTDFQILLCIIRGQGCRIQSKMSAGIQSEKFSRCRRVNRYNICKRLVGFDNDGNPVNEAGDGWGYYDLGLQNENLLLKATELGLDTLVMGIRDGEAIREMLHIPETENVVAVIAVGYKAKEANMPKRKELEEIAKFF